MLSPRRFLAFGCFAAFLLAGEARALVIYGTGPNSLDNSFNSTAPGNGEPWANVALFGAGNASGVYLGNGYVITADHVNMVDNGIVINGVPYDRDLTFTPLQLVDGIGTPDLKLVKIVGLPPTPVVAKLPINYSASDDTNATCVMIGWGEGKDAVISGQGWTWSSGVRAQRWGTNGVPGVTPVPASGPYPYAYDALYTSFVRPLFGSSTVAQMTIGDSGSGLFQFIDGTWKLSGVATLVTQLGVARYDNDTETIGNQPDHSFYVRLQKYAFVLRYENWANAKLGSPTAAESADPDNDGVSNLLEYAFHTVPNSTGSFSTPVVGHEPGFVTLTYTKLMSATDLSYVVEATDELAPSDWQPATVTEEVVSDTGLAWTIKAKVALTTETKKFLRLVVTRVP